MKKIIADKKMYYIAYNEDKSIVHAGEILEAGLLMMEGWHNEKNYS